MEMMDKTCKDFLGELASRSATPGGGGAAALVGAVGAALGNMVGCLTAGKPKYAAVEGDILALNQKAAALRARLEGLVEADAAAVPLEIMEACGEAIALLEEYEAKGSVLAVSDAGCGAVFCRAALEAAGLNVAVNTRLMADRGRAAALDARAEALRAEYLPRAEAVYAKVCHRLGGN